MSCREGMGRRGQLVLPVPPTSQQYSGGSPRAWAEGPPPTPGLTVSPPDAKEIDCMWWLAMIWPGRHTVKGLPFWGRAYLGFGSITIPGPQGEGRRGGIWEWRCPLTGQDSGAHGHTAMCVWEQVHPSLVSTLTHACTRHPTDMLTRPPEMYRCTGAHG